jgi:hypothetical protein
MPVECERANFLSVSDSENVQLHTESPAANRPQPLSALPCNFFETLKDRSDLNVTPTVQLETRSRAPSTHLNPFRIDVLWLRWYWEIGACLGSLAAFLSIFGLLKAYDGKTQPNWQYDITLNSVISWLAAIMKGMLLVPAASCISQSTWIYYTSRAHSLEILSTYDSASRGPWGSVQLLWALRAR